MTDKAVVIKEESTITKVVNSIGTHLTELTVVEKSLSSMLATASKKYEEKLNAEMENMTLEELTEHLKFIYGANLQLLDAKRKLLIKGLQDQEPLPKEIMDLFKIVNTAEKKAKLQSLLEEFTKSEDL